MSSTQDFCSILENRFSNSFEYTQQEWIKSQIAKDHYGNDSEVISELIRERQLIEQETSAYINSVRKNLKRQNVADLPINLLKRLYQPELIMANYTLNEKAKQDL